MRDGAVARGRTRDGAVGGTGLWEGRGCGRDRVVGGTGLWEGQG